MFFFEEKANRKIFFYLSFLIFFFMISMHNGSFLKGDYQSYVNLFLGKSSAYGDLDVKGGYVLEPLFYYFMKALRLIIPRNPFAYVLLYSFVILLPFIFIAKKVQKSASISLVYFSSFMCGMITLFLMHAQRQMISTVFLLWGFYVFEYTKLKKKNLIALVLLTIALTGHSSTFFVLLMGVAIYFFKMPANKRGIEIFLIASIFLGYIFSKYFFSLLTEVSIFLNDFEATSRSTYYLTEDVYGEAEIKIRTLILFSASTFIAVLYSDKKEMNSFGLKCLFFATIIYNFFNAVPLMNRLLVVFVMLGFILGMPQSITRNSRCKYLFLILAFLHIVYNCIKINFSEPSPLLPYPYIWNNI